MRHHLDRPAQFVDRHVGPSDDDIAKMLQALELPSLDALVDETVPSQIRTTAALKLPQPLSEFDALKEFEATMAPNEVRRSYIGTGYYGTIVPPVIQRNVLENPGWYTQYTPYQAEIAQGRLEALFVFQTMVADLCGLPVANASLLDEATAVAEGVALCVRANRKSKSTRALVASDLHPQSIEVVRTRCGPLGIDVEVVDVVGSAIDDLAIDDVAVLVLQYPTSDGRVEDYRALTERVHAQNGCVVVATDLLALTLLTPPGEWGADVAVGNAQRFGVPLGFGGPHAAFMATTEAFQRNMPGRLVGQSIDARGEVALRLALQTREQHIRREKATSNICTAQVLLAIMSGMYAVYHGADGLRAIARRVRALTELLTGGLRAAGFEISSGARFDTVTVDVGARHAEILRRADDAKIDLRRFEDTRLGVSLDEVTTPDDVATLLEVFSGKVATLAEGDPAPYPDAIARTSPFLTHPTFESYRSETEFLRWVTRLQSRDLSLTTSMIPLGSCTMKLNATTEMLPITWSTVNNIHPFAPRAQWRGYEKMLRELEQWLAEITGMHATSLQPNAGSQGEYAGMLVIRAYHEHRGEAHRDVCLIPQSAHGTNPASAVMAGMRVVVVACDEDGNIDVPDLDAKIEKHRDNLAAVMITYPSTHGVFETTVREICDKVHAAGGQVYLDGANMNAQVGLCRPGEYGADVCHLNLHKTFCIPHGGGGPGIGPICAREHLAPFLPGHPLVKTGGEAAVGPVSAAPFGSASILPIPYLYIRMLGAEGLKKASQVAILNANYMAKRLEPYYPVLFRGANGRVAHEFILDLREFKREANIDFTDFAKRLMDYGFHAPTMSWPVVGTMMVEPTESESLAELDRFCDALIAIRHEIDKIASGEWDATDNPLKNAPHTAAEVTADEWDHAYARSEAAFPAPWTRAQKFWPSVARIDDAHGDRNLICTCPPLDAYE